MAKLAFVLLGTALLVAVVGAAKDQQQRRTLPTTTTTTTTTAAPSTVPAVSVSSAEAGVTDASQPPSDSDGDATHKEHDESDHH